MKRRIGSEHIRRAVFFASSIVFGGFLLSGVQRLAPVGRYPGPYGDVINASVIPERHTTDAVTAVNFDYRGFDTLGEEFILFASVVGVSLLLRRHPDESRRKQPDKALKRHVPSASDAMHVAAMLLIGPTVVFGIYLVVHGQLTPGGGFQGGVVLATAPLLVYLAGEFETFKKIASHAFVEVMEAIGAGGYAVVGLLALWRGAPFLQNVLPLGKTGDVFSAGTIAVIDLCVGLEVSAGFLLLLISYMEEMVNQKELQ